MNAQTHTSYREWSRYQWAGVYPIPADPEAPRWNLIEWVGDQGQGPAGPAIDPADALKSDSGFSGFGHNPSGNHWAEGYSH